jgi:hypothetical protein
MVFWRRILASNDNQLLISLFSGFLCFLPLIMGVTSNFEASILRHSIASNEFEYSSMILLSLAFPLAIEMVMEKLSSIAPQQEPAGTPAGPETGMGDSSYVNMNRHEMVLFLVGICIVPILNFFPDETPNLGHLYLCFSKCQLALVVGVFMIWLCRFNSRYWTPLSTVAILMCIMVHTSFLVFADNVVAIPNTTPPFMYVCCDYLCTHALVCGTVVPIFSVTRVRLLVPHTPS